MAALDLGLIFALMALGVYLTFRVLDLADLTIDGSFTTGAAVCAVLIINGGNPWLATLSGGLAGLVAGLVTGLLTTWGKIHPLLAGILTQIALYSVNLRIMGKANLSMLRAVTVFTPLKESRQIGTPVSVGVLALGVGLVVAALVWFLSTDLGLAMRATGDNEGMARAQGINTDAQKILGLALSNGLVGLSGALFAQYQGSSDIGMGIGLIVAGLASVIIGTALIPNGRVLVTAIAVVTGSIIYRSVIQAALTIEGFDTNDMKLLSALIVIAALLLPRWAVFKQIRNRRSKQFTTYTWDVPTEETVDAGVANRPSQGVTRRMRSKNA
ncbi:hypothetical protein HMPREF1531_01262 [Propionibacterium sp. oral taxon 192 str. F0372]|uniref:ABC transporter permease n=1 Tax=Propionibacterium sp. oral taxon 192 TaxID=671222 RepID=UPI00035458E0|nr:ABC transporter permease [Propionibacterium sp. oral taxon 192]EPH03205.1 hypothetical protein HMPREF1531_01262 [Propionibacterium sp. oral taxon 192 str. F0372]